MVQRREIFQTVHDAVATNANVVITLKKECDGRLSIPVGLSDDVAMDILEFLDRTHGDLTVGEMDQALQAAVWWLTTTQVL